MPGGHGGKRRDKSQRATRSRRPQSAAPPPAAPPTAERSELPLDAIQVDASQPRDRFDEAALQTLADSLTEHGLLSPILVRAEGEGYVVVAGERRLRAARLAGWHTIAVRIRDNCAPTERLVLGLVENLQRQDLDPIERAKGYRALIDEHQKTMAEVGQLVGLARTSVVNALRLLKLPPTLQDKVQDAQLSAGHGRALLGLDEADTMLGLADEVVDKGLSVRATEERVRVLNRPPEPPHEAPSLPPHFTAAADILQDKLGTQVQIRQGPTGGGRLSIAFDDHAELARVLDTLGQLPG
jgi:ParB family transcriptional regulator, chromosome partitioning protein